VEVTITGAGARHEALTALLNEHGAHGFYPEGNTFRAYVAASVWGEAKANAVRQWLDAHAPEAALHIDTIPARNWNAEWEASVKPQHIGPFFVRPSWSDAAPPSNAYPPLVIDPKMSFGTGYHATTRLVLELMSDLPFDGARVLDVGTGTGILAIAACRAGAARVDAIDIDTWAVENTRENIAQNDVAERVQVHHGTLADLPLASADIVLANIHRAVLIDLMPQFAERLREGGHCICAGCLLDDAPAMRQAAREQGFTVTNERSSPPWWAVHLARAGA
jgi:ribosomal protein L11 methyltransferase